MQLCSNFLQCVEIKTGLNFKVKIVATPQVFFCFTNFVADVDTRSGFVSYSMIGMTGLNMVVNLVPVTIEMLQNYKQKGGKIYAKVRRYCVIKKNEKRRIKRARKEEFYK